MLADIRNIPYKYRKPKSAIKGREMELFVLLATVSDKFPTLKGAGLRDWLKENGNFTDNDVYRYTSSLLKKGWLTKGFIKPVAHGFSPTRKEVFGAIEAYLLPKDFDRKLTKLANKINIDVATVTDSEGTDED